MKKKISFLCCLFITGCIEEMPQEPISSEGTILTVSGENYSLAGNYSAGCVNNSFIDYSFTEGTYSVTSTDYLENNCTTPNGYYYNLSADIEYGETLAISDWTEGAPIAQNGSGPLSDNEPFTKLLFKITAVDAFGSISSVSVGDIIEVGFIVDDTDTTTIVLYPIDSPSAPAQSTFAIYKQ